jgi:hypothetical protein
MGNKSKYQKYIVETINRADIKNADYNPRLIDDENKKALKKALKKHGLVEAIVWNRRTGNLVGGHQRLQALDTLEKNQDYSLDVCVVDVDQREEAVLNVQLNNPSLQGDWDLNRLEEMVTDFDISFDDMGFSEDDIDFMFDGDDKYTEMFETEETEATKNAIADVKEARQEMRDKYADKNNIEFYAVLVFKDKEEKKEFYKKISLPIYEEYLTTDILKRLEG